MFICQFFTLAAKALPHLLPEAARINELHLPFAMLRLAIAQYPDIRIDAGVVKHVRGQTDDRLHKIIFQHISSDFAFARTLRRR